MTLGVHPAHPRQARSAKAWACLRSSPPAKEPWRWCVPTQISHPALSRRQQTRALTAAKLPSSTKLQSQGRWPCNSSLAASFPCLHSLPIRNQETFFFFEHFKKQQQPIHLWSFRICSQAHHLGKVSLSMKKTFRH